MPDAGRLMVKLEATVTLRGASLVALNISCMNELYFADPTGISVVEAIEMLLQVFK